MSDGYIAKDSTTQYQALKVEELDIAGLDNGVYQFVLTSTFTISANSLANPTVITSSAPHGLTTGQMVTISGSNSTPSINGSYFVTVTDSTHFSIPVNVTVAGTSGSFSTGNCFVMVNEPVTQVYLARLKVDSTNTFTEYAQSSITICDSVLLTAGGNAGAIEIAGLVAIQPNDCLIVKYVTQE